MAQKTTIMIDGYNLALERGTGIATYGRNLSRYLGELGFGVDILYGSFGLSDADPALREIAFFDPPKRRFGRLPGLRRAIETVAAMRGIEPLPIPITGNVIASDGGARLPHFDRLWGWSDLFHLTHRYFRTFGRSLNVRMAEPPAVVHWTYPLPIRVTGAKNVYTLHDVVPLRLPYTTLDDKENYKKLLSMLCREADHLVTVSETSKKDIIEYFGLPETKITNTYQSVEIPARLTERSDDEVKAEIEGVFGLRHKEYFLFYGAIEPKKNVGRLIEAYLGSQVSTPLVIVGSNAWKSDQELRLLKESSTPIAERVIQLQHAPFTLLIALIRGAKAVLFPSLYEGFGLPVLESMKLGTPVLTSRNGGSTAEIGGNAALLVDAYDPHDIANGIKSLEQDLELRQQLAQRGLRRAADFSGERYAAALDSLYRKVL